MAKEKQPLFKCGNDMKINVSKFNGEVVFDEECCTIVGVIMKNTGEIATSFFGAHNPEVIKVLEKSLKMYFKSIKKTLKSEFAKEDPNDIKVVGGEIPEDSKWSGEPVPDAKQDKSSKTSSATKNKKTTKTAPKKNTKK
jgi:hypothetical protein